MTRDIRLTNLFTLIAVLFSNATAKPYPIVSTINNVIVYGHRYVTSIKSFSCDNEISDTELEPSQSASIFNLLTNSSYKSRILPGRRSTNGGNVSRYGKDECIKSNPTTYIGYLPYKLAAIPQGNMRYYIYLRNLRI